MGKHSHKSRETLNAELAEAHTWHANETDKAEKGKAAALIAALQAEISSRGK